MKQKKQTKPTSHLRLSPFYPFTHCGREVSSVYTVPENPTCKRCAELSKRGTK